MKSLKVPRLILLVAATALLTAAAGCGGSSGDSGGGSSTKIDLVAYSTPAAYEKLIAAFQKTDAGKNVKFTQSYGASGDQSRAVEAGLPADYVAFSLETDMTRLVDAGLVDADWNTGQHKGMVTDSVVVLVIRKGNPKNIKTWDDLIKPGVEVITPNPFTSGGARWNIMAAYGSQLKQGKTEAEATRTSRRCSATSRCRTTARARRCRPSPAARVTCCSPTRTRRSSPSRTARTSTTSCPTPRS